MKTEESKYHYGREIIFNLRSCHAISTEVYLHWLDKINKEEAIAVAHSSLKLREIDTLSFGAWVNKYYRYCLDGYIDLETQEFKSEKQLLKIYKENNLNP